jgi:F0F1-type ATP synthase membrane subunit c/vacuolar-type H+-ATPase subunit K
MPHPIALILGLIIGVAFIVAGIFARKFPRFTEGMPPIERGPEAVEKYSKRYQEAKLKATGVAIAVGVVIIIAGLALSFI